MAGCYGYGENFNKCRCDALNQWITDSAANENEACARLVESAFVGHAAGFRVVFRQVAKLIRARFERRLSWTP